MCFRAYALTDGLDISRFGGVLRGPANHQHPAPGRGIRLWKRKEVLDSSFKHISVQADLDHSDLFTQTPPSPGAQRAPAKLQISLEMLHAGNTNYICGSQSGVPGPAATAAAGIRTDSLGRNRKRKEGLI